MKDKVMYDRLVYLLITEKSYRKPEVNLNYIAHKLHTNKTYLSTFVNHHYKMNVPTLLNRIRLEDAKEILKRDQYENVSIHSIYTAVGFHSKSVFNNFFKVETGLTPRQFRDRALKGEVADMTNLPHDFHLIDLRSIDLN